MRHVPYISGQAMAAQECPPNSVGSLLPLFAETSPAEGLWSKKRPGSMGGGQWW